DDPVRIAQQIFTGSRVPQALLQTQNYLAKRAILIINYYAVLQSRVHNNLNFAATLQGRQHLLRVTKIPRSSQGGAAQSRIEHSAVKPRWQAGGLPTVPHNADRANSILPR